MTKTSKTFEKALDFASRTISVSALRLCYVYTMRLYYAIHHEHKGENKEDPNATKKKNKGGKCSGVDLSNCNYTLLDLQRREKIRLKFSVRTLKSEESTHKGI